MQQTKLMNMNKTTKINNIDFRCNPYRGAFTDVAKELSKKKNKKVSRITIFRMYNNGEPEITQLVDKEIERRERIYLNSRNRKPVYELEA